MRGHHPAFPLVSGGLLLPLLRLLLHDLLLGLLLRAGVVAAEVRHQEEEEQPREGQEWLRRQRRRRRPEEEQLHLQGRHLVRDRPKAFNLSLGFVGGVVRFRVF